MMRFFLLLTLIISAAFSANSIMFVKPEQVFQTKATLDSFHVDRIDFVNNKLGDFSPEVLIAPYKTPETGGCDKGNIFLSQTQEKNIYELASPMNAYNCSQIEKVRKNKELNPEICMSLANCFRSKPQAGFSLLMKAKENAAAEVVSLMASTTIHQMTELEELKAYAAEKYGVDFIPESCREDQLKIPVKPDSTTCMTRVIDKGFELAQKTCFRAEIGCHSDYLDFINEKTTQNGSTSLMAEFIKHKTLGTSKKIIAEDNVTTKEIAKLMMNSSMNPEERAEAIQEFFKSNYQSLDPIYKYYTNEYRKSIAENSKNEVKEGFIKYINSNNGRSPAEVVIELDMLRKKEAKKRLEDSCGNQISIPKLCKIVTDVLNGSEIQVPEKNFDRLMKNQFVSFTNAKSNIEEIAENVARCNTFSIAKTIGKNVVSKFRLSGGFNLFSSGPVGSYFIKEVNLNGISSGLYSEDTRPILILNDAGEISKRYYYGSKETVQITSSKEIAPERTVLATKFSNNEVMKDVASLESRVVPVKNEKTLIPEIKIPALKDETTRFASKESEPVNMAQSLAQQQNLANSRNLIPNVTRAQEIIIDTPTSPGKVIPVKATENAEYSQLMNKISGLEEKLAAAKKKSIVDSSGASLMAAEESSLARELKMAAATLADLKAKNALKESDASDVLGESSTKNKKSTVKKINEDDDDDDDSESEVSSPVVKDTRKGVAPQSATSAGSASGNSPAAGARNSASIEETSVEGRSSGGSAGEFARTDAVVLTGLDGASTTKITESINKMIIAEAGKPFYIEEGGFVKEIIPEIVNGVIVKGEDGAPVYKTVIKGKVGEFKIDSKGLKFRKDLITKSTSAADVKRQDEEKSRAEVIRYREFQGIFKPKK